VGFKKNGKIKLMRVWNSLKYVHTINSLSPGILNLRNNKAFIMIPFKRPVYES